MLLARFEVLLGRIWVLLVGQIVVGFLLDPVVDFGRLRALVLFKDHVLLLLVLQLAVDLGGLGPGDGLEHGLGGLRSGGGLVKGTLAFGGVESVQLVHHPSLRASQHLLLND